MKPMLQLLAVLLFLTACGGGGGGGGDGGSLPLSLSFTPNPLRGSAQQHELPLRVSFTATVRGSTSANTVIAFITDLGGNFEPNSFDIIQTNQQTYVVGASTRSDLTVGEHSNNLMVRLCADNACRRLLGQATLPYTISVQSNTPPSVNSLSPASVTAALFADGQIDFSANLDGHVEDSVLYAVISDPGASFVSSSAITLSRAGNRFDGQLTVRSDVAMGARSASVEVSICRDIACANRIGRASLPYSLQVFSLLAGVRGQQGHQDGPGASALFQNPQAMAFDQAGNLLVADTNNFSLRKIDATGTVSTLARLDGRLTGLSTFGDNVLVSNASRHIIQRRANDGSISTVFGRDGSCCTPGDLNEPSGIAAKADGTAYVVDRFDYNLRGFPGSDTAQGPFINAGSQRMSGSSDGSGSAARFGGPSDVLLEADGSLIVVDFGNHSLRRVTSDGSVSTLAGRSGVAGESDGTGSAALFRNPQSAARDVQGNIYVVDRGAAVRRVTPTGTVTTLFSELQLPSGTSENDFPANLFGIEISADGKRLVLSDTNNQILVETRLP